MYQFEKTNIKEGKAFKYKLHKQGERLSYINFITSLKEDETFRCFFIGLLSDISFQAYHWETPPVTTGTTSQLFEFVVSDSPGIDLPPDPGPFRPYFSPDKETTAFANLGKDATLIAPAPSDQERNYSHIGVFTENAPVQQQHHLWQTVGRVTQNRISDRPLWLNTAGGGVAWLHVRLDSRPKYYRHRPYTNLTES